MKAKIFNLVNETVGEMLLNDDVFALQPRQDIIKLVIDWQLAKARAGTHQTKTISEVSGTTRKPFKQKGTGNARQGSLRSVQMRGGGIAHGPVTRSHAIKLPKKVRKLGLKHALSVKMAEGKIVIIDLLTLDNPKSADLSKKLENFAAKNFFIVGGNEVDHNFSLAAQNLRNVTSVPQIGINVYDIIRNDFLLLSQEAVNILQERLK